MWTLCLALARQCSPSVQHELERTFAWWSSEEESDDLAEVVRRHVSTGRLDAGTLFHYVCRRYLNGWSVYRCLALVQTLVDADGGLLVAPEDVSAFRGFYSHLLGQDDQNELALSIAETGLGRVPERSHDAALLRQECARHHRSLGEFSAAERHLEQALEILRELGDHAARDRRAIERELASLLEDVGRFEEAERLYQHAASVDESQDASVELVEALGDLSELYIHLDRLADAEAVLVRGVDVLEQVLGGEQPATARLRREIASSHEGAEWLDSDAGDVIRAPGDSDPLPPAQPTNAYKSWPEFYEVWETYYEEMFRRVRDAERRGESAAGHAVVRTWKIRVWLSRLRRLAAEHEQR